MKIGKSSGISKVSLEYIHLMDLDLKQCTACMVMVSFTPTTDRGPATLLYHQITSWTTDIHCPEAPATGEYA
jgi:hypothetical protein